jgi:galactokinase
MTGPLNASDIPAAIAKRFVQKFASNPRIFRAPGRVNLIGEHTDYNDGFVLPAAIDLYTWAAIAARNDHTINVFSENLNQHTQLDLRTTDTRAKNHWSDYVAGVVSMVRQLGVVITGADIAIFSTIPAGAGLSSSAALEVSVASALLSASNHSLGLLEIAKLSQGAEVEFVGARVGIMDQFASCFGSAGHALLLDCRSLAHTQFPLPPGIAMVVCNTMVKHGHSGGEYNQRRAQCEQGVQILKSLQPGVFALRDVSLTQLLSHRAAFPEVVFRRCRHVVNENERVLRFVNALEYSAFPTLGTCMAESHLSLKNDFEVSCPELDVMVRLAAECEGVIGSRMTGGGFGGCTINLVESKSVPAFTNRIAKSYKQATQIDPDIYVLRAASGTVEVSLNS